MNKRLRAQLAHIAEQRAPKPKVSLEKADAVMAGAFNSKGAYYDLCVMNETSIMTDEEVRKAFEKLNANDQRIFRNLIIVNSSYGKFGAQSPLYKPHEGAQAAFINAAMPLDKP